MNKEDCINHVIETANIVHLLEAWLDPEAFDGPEPDYDKEADRIIRILAHLDDAETSKWLGYDEIFEEHGTWRDLLRPLIEAAKEQERTGLIEACNRLGKEVQS